MDRSSRSISSEPRSQKGVAECLQTLPRARCVQGLRRNGADALSKRMSPRTSSGARTSSSGIRSATIFRSSISTISTAARSRTKSPPATAPYFQCRSSTTPSVRSGSWPRGKKRAKIRTSPTRHRVNYDGKGIRLVSYTPADVGAHAAQFSADSEISRRHIFTA